MTDLLLALALIADPPTVTLRADTLIVRARPAPVAAGVMWTPPFRRYVEVARYVQSGTAACCMRVIHADPELFAYHYPRIRHEAHQAARWRSYGWNEQHVFPVLRRGMPAMPPGAYRARVCARVAQRDTCGEWSAWVTLKP